MQNLKLIDHQNFQILGFQGEDTLVQRLKQMGLHEGMSLQYLRRAPMRGPLIYRFGATALALRAEEAQCLILKKR